MFGPVVIHCLRQMHVQQLLLIFSRNIFSRKDCLPWVSSVSGQIKTALWVQFSREWPDGSNNDRSLGMGLWRRSSPILFPPMAARCCFSPWLLSVGFSGFCKAEEEWDLDDLKCHRAHCFYWDSTISLSKGFLNCCKLLVHFQSSEKLILMIFASVLVAFIEESIFGEPCSAIFTDAPPIMASWTGKWWSKNWTWSQILYQIWQRIDVLNIQTYKKSVEL